MTRLKNSTVSGLRKGGLLLGTAAGLAAGFSGLYYSTQSVFLKPIAQEMGWNRTETAALPGIAMLGFAIGGPLLGLLIDRFGARPLIAISGIVFAASLFVLSVLPPSYAMFAAVSFAIGLLGVGTGSPGYMSLLPGAFDKRLGLALSLAMMGAGVGAAVLPGFAQRLVSLFDWHTAYRGLAAIALGTVLCVLPLLKSRRVIAGDKSTAGKNYLQAVRDRRFWTLMALMFVCSAGGLGAILHLVPLLTDQAVPSDEAAHVAAMSGVGLLAGRFLGGFLMDILFAPLVAAIGFLMGGIGLALLALLSAPGLPVLTMSATLFGFALGAEGDFAAFSVRRYFGKRAFGAIYGTLITAYSLGGVFGPIGYGAAYDWSGNYRSILLTAAGGYVFAAVAALSLGKYAYASANEEGEASGLTTPIPVPSQ